MASQHAKLETLVCHSYCDATGLIFFMFFLVIPCYQVNSNIEGIFNRLNGTVGSVRFQFDCLYPFRQNVSSRIDKEIVVLHARVLILVKQISAEKLDLIQVHQSCIETIFVNTFV